MKFGSDNASHDERCSQGHSSGYITNAADREKDISLAAMIVGKENVQDAEPLPDAVARRNLSDSLPVLSPQPDAIRYLNRHTMSFR
ncbi:MULTISPECIES: hypothetical protein [Rhizobium]|nr:MULTISPECIES: hypothetical protein [Rhizobium]UIJ83024.1 hypothetical protein LZK78_27150 [Rhizobium leguminosarum]